MAGLRRAEAKYSIVKDLNRVGDPSRAEGRDPTQREDAGRLDRRKLI
jgi:hypothetical protein